MALVTIQNCQVQNAKFVSANLNCAYLAELDLTGSDFSQSRLVACNMARSTLQGCEFAKAMLIGTNLAGVDLKGVNLQVAYQEAIQTEEDELPTERSAESEETPR